MNKNTSTEPNYRKLTFGEHLSDKFAEIGGSWHFIIIFTCIIITWIFINTYLYAKNPFDPYPYILLNLVLSCIAALQAPIIMMSQNRKEAIDRARAEDDYRINLKAELEILNLHKKMDQLVADQLGLLIEIQKNQLAMMQEQKK